MKERANVEAIQRTAEMINIGGLNPTGNDAMTSGESPEVFSDADPMYLGRWRCVVTGSF